MKYDLTFKGVTAIEMARIVHFAHRVTRQEATVTMPGAITVRLVSWSVSEKIPAIKAVRVITGMGLKEAKDLVEGTMPVTLMRFYGSDAESMARVAVGHLDNANCLSEMLR